MSSRPIRSFVLRQGRLSSAQSRACDELMPSFGIAYNGQPVDFERAFGRRAPCTLEIGFGMGDTLAATALARPERNFIGIEVHLPGVGALLRLIEAHGLTNVRVIRHDAVEVLQHMIAADSLDEINLFFPDPWPKKRHHKRRIVTAEFTALMASRLAPGGLLHMATDWESYAEQMLQVVSAEARLVNTADGYAARPDARPQTRFERRGLALGHVVHDLVFKRPVAP